MLQLLTEFINQITAIVNFFINSVSSLINLFTKIPTYVTFIATSVSVLPSIIIPFALAAVAICVVLFILGR